MSEYRSVKYFLGEAVSCEQERLERQTQLPVYQGIIQRRLTERGIGSGQTTTAARLRLLQDDRRVMMGEKTAVKVLITAMVIVVLIAIAYYFQS